MRILVGFFILLMAASFSSVAKAQIGVQGGSSFKEKIGPWHLSRSYYENGGAVCWADNYSYSKRRPAFSWGSVVTKNEKLSLIIRFTARKNARKNETVTLIVGDEQFKLVHNPGAGKKSFSPKTAKDSSKIHQLIKSRQAQKNKAFFIIDEKRGEFKYDARRFTDMISYFEKHCV